MGQFAIYYFTDFAQMHFSVIFATHLQKGPVAQLNRASDYGSEGFRFES